MPNGLSPPGIFAGAEIFFSPLSEVNPIACHISVGDRQGSRSRTTDHFARRVVLRTMARTHKLVLTGVPRHHATQVGADSVNAIVRDRTIFLNDHIGRVALQSLGEFAGAREVGREVFAHNNVVTQCVLRGNTTATATFGRRDEVVDYWVQCAQCHSSHGAEGQQIHKLATAHAGNVCGA